MTRPGRPLSSLLNQAVIQALRPGATPADVDLRTYAAAIRVLARRGTRGATMSDVAAESGVSRATLFRRYASKDHLFEQALAHEFKQLLDRLANRFKTLTDPTEQVIETFQACLQLVDHIVPRDADTIRRAELIQTLSRGEPSPVTLSRNAVRAHIAKAQANGQLPPGDSEMQADALIHTLIGYLVAPGSTADLADGDELRRLARVGLAPILTGGVG